MSTNSDQDFFSLFNLPRQFAVNVPALEHAWRTAAAQVHPDRYTHSSDAEKRSALRQITRINDAYQTLKSPIKCACYLLELAGIKTQEDGKKQMPEAFLMAQMDWRERVEEARVEKNLTVLQELSRQLRADNCAHQGHLEQAIDHRADWDAAVLLVQKMRFFEALEEEISDAIEFLLDESI